MELDEAWRVASGGNSKEADVQRNRNRRERETTYQSLQTIPLNPKEPWDREMDYDDSLTPEIPSEQPPEEIITEPQDSLAERRTTAGAASTSSQTSSSEPDFELLAALLNNPGLVFALTSGKPGNIAGQDMVKLLDVIKTGEQNSSSSSINKVEERVEVSLPSPTPSTNPVMVRHSETYAPPNSSDITGTLSIDHTAKLNHMIISYWKNKMTVKAKELKPALAITKPDYDPHEHITTITRC